MEKELAEHNMRLLEEQLRRTGFGDEVVEAMREKVSEEKEKEFYIPYQAEVDGKRFSGLIHGDSDTFVGQYAMDYYTLDLGKDSGRPLRENAFHYTIGYDVNLREAFNMMQGRPVYREPLFDQDHHGYWVTLSDERISQGEADFNYERAAKKVEDGIAASPLKILLLPEIKLQLAEALRRGDRTMLTVETMGSTKQIWVEMDPLRESLKLTDRKGKVVSLPELEREMAEDYMRSMERKLRLTGFGDEVVAAMREKVSEGKENKFYIPYHEEINGKIFNGLVHFERTSTGDPYVPNYYSLDLGKDSGRPLRENAFYFTTGQDVHLLEAFNLMQGRAVYRAPLFYQDHLGYWVTLRDDRISRGAADLSYERSEREPEDWIAASPLKTLLNREAKNELAHALRLGDRAMVTVETMGLTKEVWVEMAPLREGLKLTDRKGKVVGLAELGIEQKMEAVVEKKRGLKR